MPQGFNVIFFSVGQDTYRLHFPYILGDVDKKMLTSDEGGKYNSDTREYRIGGFTYGNSTYDIRVKEVGADILPGKIEAWFKKDEKEAQVPPDLHENIRARNEDATQGRIAVYVNGKQV